MRVKRFAQILLAAQAVLVVVLGISTYLLERRFELLNHSRDIAFRSYLLADELRQSSDDLTRLSRAFVVTEDPKLEREYWAVLNIRNGKLPRPQPRAPGKASSLRQLMLDEGFTAAELAKLDEAQKDSDVLVRTEARAMNAVRGLFDDGSGHFTLARAPDRELALRLLHDDTYHQAKRRIARSIDEFFAIFQTRTTGAVAGALNRSRAQLQWLSVLLATTLALFVGSFAALLRQNAQREAAQLALAESEARYRTIFQTATDGFILVDEQTQLLEVNDALCRMSGYSAEELRSRRVSDLEAADNETEMTERLEHARSHGDERFSTRLKHRDGSTLDVEISAQHRPIDSGRFVMVIRDVTELRRAQAAQRESEELLMSAFLASPAAIWVSEGLDAQACVAINDAFETTTGFTREEAIGKTADELSLYEHSRARDMLLEELRTTGEVRGAELRFRKKDGALRDGVLNAQTAPVGDKSYVLVVLTDVTEAKHAQRELELLLRETSEGQARMRTLLEMLDDAPAGIVINSQGTLVYANKQAAAMHGYTREELQQRTIVELMAPEERSRVETLRSAIHERGVHAFTVWHQRRDGSRLHLDNQVRLSTWLGQEVTIGVLVDLSEHDRTESELRQSEERYRLLAENISDVISVVNVETRRFEYVSPSVLQLRGYTAEEAMRQLFEATLTSESHVRARQRLAELLEEEAAGRAQPPTADDAVYHQLCKGGGTVPTEVRSRLLRDPTSGKPMLLSVARDISERRKSAQEHEDLLQQLYQAQKMEAIGVLAGGVAHDFNNLLSVIMTYTDFVVDKLPDDDRRRSDLVEVQKASDRAAELVRQLLAFSRKQILEPRVVDLNQVVSGIEKMLRRLLGEDILLEVLLAEGLGSVLADPGQLEQVLMNLVVNARDAMPRGGRLTIQTSNLELAESGEAATARVKPGRYAAFSVTDSGAGMDETTLARVFEPFFTTKGPGKGTGLGLSTVYGIVKQSEGEVGVSSQLGVGTAFTVYLPRRDAPLSAPVLEPVAVASGGHETVLVVEDEHDLRGLIERILRSAGYTVLVAENGAEALARFDEHQGKVDLLLTDAVMPQMSGRELAEHLAQRKPELKVLYMSGYTREIIDRHGVLEDGMRLISKPFTAVDMSRTVRLVLDEAAGAPKV